MSDFPKQAVEEDMQDLEEIANDIESWIDTVVAIYSGRESGIISWIEENYPELFKKERPISDILLEVVRHLRDAVDKMGEYRVKYLALMEEIDQDLFE